MQKRNKLRIGLIVISIIILFSYYSYYVWESNAPCRSPLPPDKLIIGHITQGWFPNGTYWVSDGKTTYIGYFIDLNIVGFHASNQEGRFPNGTQYANIRPYNNPNVPSWCNE